LLWEENEDGQRQWCVVLCIHDSSIWFLSLEGYGLIWYIIWAGTKISE
jgi:hypothetical protein